MVADNSARFVNCLGGSVPDVSSKVSSGISIKLAAAAETTGGDQLQPTEAAVSAKPGSVQASAVSPVRTLWKHLATGISATNHALTAAPCTTTSPGSKPPLL